jgi:GDPmannose 4,6-dehydratase
LGNLNARRDWGYAPEYVVAMWKMLQIDEPSDFVIGTGTDRSVNDFVRIAFECVGLNWENHVRFDEKYLRPTEVDTLIGDANLAKTKLGWSAKVMPEELAQLMVEHDLQQLSGHVVDVPRIPEWNE